MKRFMGLLAVLALLVLMGCRSAEEKAMFEVVDLLGETKERLCEPDTDNYFCLDGAPFMSGHSLIVSCDCDESSNEIFWARDGVLYAVNDAAKAKAPTLAAAPPEITAEEIIAALEDHE